MMRTASHSIAARARQPHERLRVLILSHMFPRPELPHSGPFVHEQVRALREHADVDARVVTCRPLPLNCFRPARCRASLESFFDLPSALAWQSSDDVPTVYLPFFAGGLVRRWMYGRTYSHAIMRAANWLRSDFAPHIIHAHTAYLDGGARVGFRINGASLRHHRAHRPILLLTRHPLIRRWTRRAFQGASRTWCVSDSLARRRLRRRQHVHRHARQRRGPAAVSTA